MKITHQKLYVIRVAGVPVGQAFKRKGKFDFKAFDGAGVHQSKIGTMKKLKEIVGNNVPKAYLDANKATEAFKLFA